jgi:hypothetical protein
MRYATPAAFRAALEARLRAQATGGHASLVRLRKHVVFDRLLARLLVVAPGRWIVKGGLALDYRYGDKARTTVDLDLSMWEGIDRAARDMVAVQRTDLGDMFTFSIRAASELRITKGSAVRHRILASLDDRKFEEVVVDVGLREDPFLDPDLLRGPVLLEFAGIPAIEVPAISLNHHVAEKLHAYVREFHDGRPNTRMKDLVDLNLIAAFSSFEAAPLRLAIGEVFGGRADTMVPNRLPPPPSFWQASYPRLAGEVGLDEDVDQGHARAAAFLDPLLAGTLDANARWDSTAWKWRVPVVDRRT